MGLADQTLKKVRLAKSAATVVGGRRSRDHDHHDADDDMMPAFDRFGRPFESWEKRLHSHML